MVMEPGAGVVVVKTSPRSRWWSVTDGNARTARSISAAVGWGRPARVSAGAVSLAWMTSTAISSSEELLGALDGDRREVAQHLTGPLGVLGGAGAGKTRAITYRIAHGVRSGAYTPT